ncbi:MAG: TetR family transcriptional regulator [Oscillospiraceae bacterium]|nr:TetR family transcriptional regulator [Oscillospiraceae bacterium]
MINYSMKTRKCELRTKQAFQKALTTLVMKKPFNDVSVSEIINESGYSRTTFYAYYQDKYDMADKIISDEINNFAGCISSPVRESGHIIYDGKLFLPALVLFRHAAEYRELYHIILNDMFPGHKTENFCKKAAVKLSNIFQVELTEEISGIDMDLYFYINTYTYMLLIKYWEENDYKYSP